MSRAYGWLVVQALRERDAELAALAAGVDGARAGAGALLVVEGPAGIGKSSLLAAVAQAARERHITVLHARGRPLEQTFSFGIARQRLEPVRATCGPAEWAQLTAGAAALAGRALEAPADHGGLGEDAAHGLFWLVANLATWRATPAVVDDARWADPPSLRWLAHLARRLEGLPLLLAVAVRAGEPSSYRRLLDELLAAAGERRCGRAATATHFAGAVDDGFCAACHAATGAATRSCFARSSPRCARGRSPPAARRRPRSNPSAPRRSLAWSRGSSSGCPPARSSWRAPWRCWRTAPRCARVAALAGLELPRAARVADALRAAGVLAPATRVEFVHPVVRAAIYAGLGPGERGLWHTRAARLLRAEGAEPERVATHLLRTEPTGAENT